MYVFIYRERKGGRKKGKETQMWQRNIDRSPCVHAPTGDTTHNPAVCLNQVSNLQIFALWDDTQPTEPHQSGPVFSFLTLTMHNVILLK